LISTKSLIAVTESEWGAPVAGRLNVGDVTAGRSKYLDYHRIRFFLESEHE